MHGPGRLARYVVLGSGALIAGSRSAAYSPGTNRPSLNYLSPAEQWFGLSWWAIVWGVVAVLLVVSMFVRRISITSMSLLTGLLTFWGFTLWWAWLFDGSQRTWVTGALFVGAAAWAAILTSMMERGR